MPIIWPQTSGQLLPQSFHSWPPQFEPSAQPGSGSMMGPPPPPPPGGAIGGSGPVHETEQSDDATHWPIGSHIWPGGHWNPAWHMSGHAIPIWTPHVGGHMLPQSFQTCPPQLSPWAQSSAGAQSAPKELRSWSRSLTSTLPSPLTSEPSAPLPPKPERRDRRSFTLCRQSSRGPHWVRL